MAWKKSESKDRIIAALQQMFPALAESKVDEVARLTESYHKYKGEYVKHISFDPNKEDLGEFWSVHFHSPSLHYWVAVMNIEKRDITALIQLFHSHFLIQCLCILCVCSILVLGCRRRSVHFFILEQF